MDVPQTRGRGKRLGRPVGRVIFVIVYAGVGSHVGKFCREYVLPFCFSRIHHCGWHTACTRIRRLNETSHHLRYDDTCHRTQMQSLMIDVQNVMI